MQCDDMRQGQNTPLISVWVVTYNHESYIAETLDSIIGQKHIDLSNMEIIISDDCSSDSTASIIRRYISKYPKLITLNVNDVNLGITRNFNVALRLCRGDFIAFLGGDDLMLPTRLSSQLAWFRANPAGVICSAGVEVFFNDTGIVSGQFYDRNFRNQRLAKVVRQVNQLPSSRFMIRRSGCADVFFDERTPVVSDWLFFNEIATRGDFGEINEIGIRYRRHQNNTTAAGMQNAYLDDRLIAVDIFFEAHPEYFMSCKIMRGHILYKHAKRCYLANDYKKARRYCFYSILEFPLSIRPVFLAVFSLLGSSGRNIVDKYRRLKKSG